MNGKRIAAILCLLWAALWAGTSIFGAVALPDAHVIRFQGPDTTGLLGFPLAIVPATGSAAFPVGGSTTPADATATPTTASQEQAFPMVYNGATWDMQRSANSAQNTTGTGVAGGAVLVWDGTNFQRQGMTTNVDTQTAAQNQAVVSARLSLYNGSTFDRTRDANTGQNTTGTGVPGFANLGWDGTNYQRVKCVTLSGNSYQQDSLGTAIAGEDLPNNIMRVGGKGGTFCKTHAPTSGTVATISQAAGGNGVKNVCTALSIGVVGNTSVPTPTVETCSLRDGATGAGTVLMTWTFVPPATVGAMNTVNLGGLWIEGSANTAMTLEFTAGLANTLEFVNFSGCTLP